MLSGVTADVDVKIRNLTFSKRSSSEYKVLDQSDLNVDDSSTSFLLYRL